MKPFFSYFLLCFISLSAIAAAPQNSNYTNRLINESSPYLQQHAHNPVDWYPWSNNAFDRARKENKPVFISIGYSTCHWCHVMARESFENQKIADRLNKNFISIKVDREERPDIDRIYITASELLAGYGGWPTTIIATPDLKPFFAATYMPPFTKDQHTGFYELLDQVTGLWNKDPQRARSVADEVTALIKEQLEGNTSAGKADAASIDLAYQYFEKTYDHEFGGFGNAPKFPRTAVFDFLLSYGKTKPESNAHKMVKNTLDHMLRGGIYDQVGGGLHRYSVDAEWRVPHFEKMLYDQGLFINTLIDASTSLNTKDYYPAIRQSLDFTLTQMRNKNGGFYSAYDADSARPGKQEEHAEGAYYVWSQQELDKLLSPQQKELFYAHFNIMHDGNVSSDPQQEFAGFNILHAEQSIDDTASQLSFPANKARKQLTAILNKLSVSRQQRPLPHLDDKIITSWNAMMIEALARAGMLLKDEQYILAAKKTALYIYRHLYHPPSGVLYRSYRNGKHSGKAYLEDYAYMTRALIHLFKATQDRQWLVLAQRLMQYQIDVFQDKAGHGFFDTTGKDKNILIRSKEIYDGAIPSANAIAVNNLIALSALLKKPGWRKLAEQTLHAFHEPLNEYFENYPQMYNSYLLLQGNQR